MPATDTALARGTGIQVTNAFFKLLGGKAKKIASEESQKMANSMEYILRHRQTFKAVGGQYPRWDPSYINIKQTRPLSKKSFDNWRVQPRTDGTYWLTNTTREEGTFNYVRSLLQGGPWRTTRSRTARLVPYKGGLYSYQMPQGLEPWKKIKRAELSKNIVTRIQKEL